MQTFELLEDSHGVLVTTYLDEETNTRYYMDWDTMCWKLYAEYASQRAGAGAESLVAQTAPSQNTPHTYGAPQQASFNDGRQVCMYTCMQFLYVQSQQTRNMRANM